MRENLLEQHRNGGRLMSEINNEIAGKMGIKYGTITNWKSEFGFTSKLTSWILFIFTS